MEILRKKITRSLPALALGCALSASAIAAPTFSVNITGDTQDANPGNGVCADYVGNCSLRAAVQEANALSPSDGEVKIQLQGAKEYVLQQTSNSRDSAQLKVSGKMRILGGHDSNWNYEKTNSIIKLGDGINSRVVFIETGAHLTLSGITVTGGNIVQSGGAGGRPGAGIHIRPGGYLLGRRLNVTGNRAMDNHGGGIYNRGYLELFQSNISDNVSTDVDNGGQFFAGGGLFNGGTAILEQTSIVDNTAVTGGAIHTIYGASSYLEGEPNTLRLNSVTIAGNVANHSGSAISSSYSDVEIVGSTIYGNSLIAGSNHYPQDGAVVMKGGDKFFDPNYTPNASHGQSVFLNNCTGCHGFYKITPENYTYKSMAAKVHNTMGFRANPPCLDECAQDVAAFFMQGVSTPSEPPVHGEVPELKVYSSIIAKNRSPGVHGNCLLRDAQLGAGSGYNVWGELSSRCRSDIASTDIEISWRDEDALEFDLITLDSAQGAAFDTQYPNENILTFYYQDGANQRVAKPTAGTTAWKNFAPSFCPPAPQECTIWRHFDGSLHMRSEPADAGAWEEKF